MFFDALGVKWEYEPEGFEFSDGTRYLPDFWLPDVGLWVEVKPSAPDEEERRKIGNLLYHSAHPVFVTCGAPGEVGEGHYSYTQQGGEWNWIYGPGYLDIVPGAPTYLNLLNLPPEHPEHDHYDGRICIGHTDATTPWYSAAQQRAIEVARSARFEFGESGAAK